MVVGEFTTEVDTLIIGSGPGGYVAAIRAAQLGQKVTVVEKEDSLGGVCLNVGCIPSKALISASHRYEHAGQSDDMGITAKDVKIDFSKLQEWKGSIVKKLTGGIDGLFKANGVEVVRGEAIFVGEKEVRVNNGYEQNRYKFENCIIATGSSPIEIPGFKWSDRVLSSTGALALTEVPKKMVVIGGGYIGIELGNAFAGFGTEVTILEGSKQILPGFEKKMAAVVQKRLKKKGVKIHTNAMAQDVKETKKGVTVTANIKDNEETFEADYVLVTVGRKPNTEELGLEQAGIQVNDKGLIEVDKKGKTNVDNIYAIGDIVPGPALAHKASYEGKVVAEVINGDKGAEIDYLAIPAVVFSDPELASVGYTEQEAKDAGYDVKSAQFPFAANGRALSLNDTDGFMKLITRKEDGLILGAQIAGQGASDMIAELGLAVETGMTAEDLSLTIHAHPTLGEITSETAEVALGHPIHIAK
ncbi:MAG TPA: dihydrolipoyl dehydrogenase [Bacillales bacterium]|nr:dihydrolipoyl dehydrogenase [Bacillales bacterium]